MDRFRRVVGVLTGASLWLVILIPILSISWLGFYTVARAVGVPPLFAAGMSASFDGVAIFAARIGLKHRRKGFSGILARITVLAFVALGAFVQSFHSDTTNWVHSHAWIVWATAPVAAAIAYELHLGWAHRKQLIKQGYSHPSAKAGYGIATWLFTRGTFKEYCNVLNARREFISDGNRRRFELQDEPVPEPVAVTVTDTPTPTPTPTRPRPKPKPRPKPEPQGPPGPRLHSVGSHGSPPSRPGEKRARRPRTHEQVVRAWALEHGFQMGHNNRVPVAAHDAYREAEKAGLLGQEASLSTEGRLR